MCPLSANTYGIEFQSFMIRDYDSKQVIFEVSKEASMAALPADFDMSQIDDEQYRRIKYEFSSDVLKLPTISTM
jgi:hypothetical protein